MALVSINQNTQGGSGHFILIHIFCDVTPHISALPVMAAITACSYVLTSAVNRNKALVSAADTPDLRTYRISQCP